MNIEDYKKKVNRLSAEIEVIKTADIIMHYDEKTKVIETKLNEIKQLELGFHFFAVNGMLNIIDS